MFTVRCICKDEDLPRLRPFALVFTDFVKGPFPDSKCTGTTGAAVEQMLSTSAVEVDPRGEEWCDRDSPAGTHGMDGALRLLVEEATLWLLLTSLMTEDPFLPIWLMLGGFLARPAFGLCLGCLPATCGEDNMTVT